MTDIDSELIEFYPIEFKLEKMDKSRDWMYEPILPHYDEKILLMNTGSAFKYFELM